MSAAAPDPLLTREGFSAGERLLIERTEEALRDGAQMQSWLRREDLGVPLFVLDLKKPYKLVNRARGFYGHLEISGVRTSIMGCRQDIEFGSIPQGDAPRLLEEFVCAEFLPRAHWTYPDGYPGGFGVEQSLYKNANGVYGRFGGAERTGCVDWRRLGTEFAWVLLTVRIYDFVMDFGPFKKRFKEAACVAPNPAFLHRVENPSPDCALEVAVGYPFVKVTPIPNVFGFGPGKFETAVKLYSFRLGHDRSVRVRMDFAAAPRAQKVFDFGNGIPDPVYGGARLLNRLTFGLYDPAPFHDKLDAQMLTTHSQVHQALMEGLAGVWRAWLPGAAN